MNSGAIFVLSDILKTGWTQLITSRERIIMAICLYPPPKKDCSVGEALSLT